MSVVIVRALYTIPHEEILLPRSSYIDMLMFKYADSYYAEGDYYGNWIAGFSTPESLSRFMNRFLRENKEWLAWLRETDAVRRFELKLDEDLQNLL